MKKTAKIIPLLVAMMFLLTGCVKLNMDFVIKANDTADMHMVMAVKKDVLNGQSIEDFLKQFGDSSDPFKDLPAEAKKETYSDDTYEGYKVSMTDQPFKDVMSESKTNTNGKIEHRDGKFFVETTPLDMGENASQAKTMFSEATMSFTFPGKIVNATEGGVIDGNKVTYQIFDLPNGTALKIEAEDGSAPNLTWLWWVLGALAVLLIAGLVWFLLRRNKKDDAAASIPADPSVSTLPAEYNVATGAPVASAGAAAASGAGAMSGAPAPGVPPVAPPPLPDHQPNAGSESDEFGDDESPEKNTP